MKNLITQSLMKHRQTHKKHIVIGITDINIMKHKITDYYPKYNLLTLNCMPYFLTHVIPMFLLSIFMWPEYQVVNPFRANVPFYFNAFQYSAAFQ